MGTLSVCIATHERAQLLPRALDGLMEQERLPDEIVVSDSSTTAHSKALMSAYASRYQHPVMIYRPSPRRALPWQRWFAFTHSSGRIVLFLDDDVWLAPTALGTLERAYDELSRTHHQLIAGIGFLQSWDDGSRPTRNASTLRERWLGTRCRSGGTVTPGGLTVSSHGLAADAPVRVDHLWGGAMSYRRDVLQRVGFLDRLAALYEAGIGRGEDAVLSAYARRYGDLYAIPQPLARHPRSATDGVPPYATRGWQLGVTGTWGRAHTLRWMASDATAYRAARFRQTTLELVRSVIALGRRLWGSTEWRRFAGACVGLARITVQSHKIPPSARSERGGMSAAEDDSVLRAQGTPGSSLRDVRLMSRKGL